MTATGITVAQFGKRFVARCTYEQKDIVKAAGFRWDPDNRYWYTLEPAVAAKFADAGTAQAILAGLESDRAQRAENVVASRAAGVDVDVELPCPDGLSYLPYQRAAIVAALRRMNVLLADEPGLGKTIETAGILNADPTLRRVLVICPASLKLNWARELRKWLVREMDIEIAQGSDCHISREGILILNYDIAARHAEKLKAVEWDAIILDEMHYLKNQDAKRTVAIVGCEKTKKREAVEGIKARRRIGLTGTPIPNRPVEGWPIFRYLDPAEFRSFWGYAKRYCNAQQNGYGWDLTGASNLPELQTKLRSSIMIRRLKADVLTELPAKRRAVVEFAANGCGAAIRAEQDAWARKEEAMLAMRAAVELAKASDNPSDYEDAVASLKADAQAAFTEISKLRHDTAVAKLPYMIEHVRCAIEDGHKVIVFAHHRDVIRGLAEEFGRECVTLFGETGMQDRQSAVDRFQSDDTCKVFIGGIMAAGVGITLTASSHVIFAELDWVPGNVTQAEDRAHRIGQRNHVLVEHLVLEGSLDARMARILVDKQSVIDAALDSEFAQEPVLPAETRERAATESSSKRAIAESAEKLTPAEIEEIHRKLQILASMDHDHAAEINGVGFSKIDSQIGHSLAGCGQLTAKQAALGAKLTNKYRRQLEGR